MVFFRERTLEKVRSRGIVDFIYSTERMLENMRSAHQNPHHTRWGVGLCKTELII